MTNPPTDTEPGSVAPSPKGGSWLSSVHGPVFWPAGILIVAFLLWGTLATDSLTDSINWVRDNLFGGLGWYYVLLVSAFVIVSLIFGLSRMGNVKLGKDDDEPEFSARTWFAMLFSAGMGIGLVFFGAAEPLWHFFSPKPGVDGTPEELGDAAMTQTILHWGIHAWAIYVIAGLAIAYAVFRKGRPISIRWALEPLLGDRVKGTLGDVIDVVAILGTVFGVATSLGIGATQISAGLGALDLVEDPGDGLLVTIIVIITLVAITSVVTGLNKGIKWLSNVNVSVAGLIALFVLIAGPTLFILREFVQSIGGYLQNILALSFDVTAFQSEAGEAWNNSWTIFYWGWWISWAPFVGMFIARISKGRTVREFVVGVLGVPVLVSIAWFSIMGGTALWNNIIAGNPIDVTEIGSENSLFATLDTLPASELVIGVTVILIVTFFVTSSDSGSLVVDMLASGGDPNPPTWSRVFWASMEGAVAIILLLAGDLAALQAGAVSLGVVFSIVMIGMMIATWKALGSDPMAVSRPREREPVSPG